VRTSATPADVFGNLRADLGQFVDLMRPHFARERGVERDSGEAVFTDFRNIFETGGELRGGHPGALLPRMPFLSTAFSFAGLATVGLGLPRRIGRRGARRIGGLRFRRSCSSRAWAASNSTC
jgi:hypothetical protein